MNLDIIVQRQLDNLSSGNGAYLEMFLSAARRAGGRTRIVFAPWRSFGNRPWAYFHPQFQSLSEGVVWPRSVRVGDYFWSTSILVWWRFAVRLIKAMLQKIGFRPTIYPHMMWA